jgi:DNA-binding transcriptional MocR family regulator
VEWTHPEGGLFTWVTLPENLNASDILKTAIEKKVAFVPGLPFYPHGGIHNTFRLNFSNANPERIREGISRLGKVLNDAIGEPTLA